MKTQLYIPKKCKVGFNPRNDTYTGMLGYVIYHDSKKWRKEDSWEGWRYKFNSPEEVEKLIVKAFNKQVEYAEKQLDYYKTNYSKDYSSRDYWLKMYNCTSLEEFREKASKQHLGKITDDERVKPVEFENIPTEGFVLNKKAGGGRSGWNHRNTYCRVYDPRGFEFEISIPNLLFILGECVSYKGKGLEGEFVYSWDGKELVLLPTCSLEYQECMKYTKLQSGKVTKEQLVEGHSYTTKDQNILIYLGKFNCFKAGKYHYGLSKEIAKLNVFWNETKGDFETLNKLDTLAEKISDTCVSNFAELMDKLKEQKFIPKPENV